VHVIEAIAVLGSFLVAAVVASVVSSWIGRIGWALMAPAALGVAGFAWVALGAGYSGWVGEVGLGLFAVAAMVLPMGLMMAKMPDAKRPLPSDKPWLALVFLPFLIGVLFPWTGRVNWAGKMAWSCDGVIVEKYHSDNHRAPTLVVRNADGTQTKLEGVSAAVWARAATADRLRKEAGHADGLLNGQGVGLVLRTGW
jgi:hypothetical protein